MIAKRVIALVATALAVPGLTSVATAQFPSPETLRADFKRFREEQHKSAAREDRLHEMFYRHTMGLPVEIAQLFALTKAEAEVPRTSAEENLNRIRHDVQNLVRQYETLKLRVKSAQKQAIVPTVQVQLPNRIPVLPKHPDAAGTDTGETATPPAKPLVQPRFDTSLGPMPGHEPRPKPPTTRPAEPVMLIKGSGDHSLVGRVLFQAGKYENAIKELTLVADQGKADFSDLFHLALCYEKLGRDKADRAMFAKANDLFSQIEARDSQEGEDGQLVLGRWGRAARTSRQTMLWLLDEGQWKPRYDVKEIRWEKEKEKR